MKLSFAICSLAGLLALACSSLSLDTPNGNVLLDGILASVHYIYGDKLDTYDLPDKVMSFNENIMLVNISATVKLHEGFITGFKSLRRTGDATIETIAEGKATLINCKLGAGPLAFHYVGKAEVTRFGVGPRILFVGGVNFTEIDISIIINSLTRNVTVTQFNLNKLQGISVKIDSPGVITDFFANLFIKAMLKIVEPIFRYPVNYVLKGMVVNASKQIPTPPPHLA